MKRILLFIQITVGLLSNYSVIHASSPTEKVVSFKIKPSETDPTIKVFNSPHLIQYNPASAQGKLLLFLPGTGGKAENGPDDFFATAIKLGYRVINLSYVDTPAVWMACGTKLDASDPNCAENFRIKRIFGENTTSLISDEPQDAIMNRFTKLLKYLAEFDKKGNWGLYLENNVPKWDLIVIAGQSQGGSMAAFIAKRALVAKVISFSGGADHASKNKLADWFFQKSVTPPERWYGTYHIKETTAKEIAKAFKALTIPENHIYSFSSEVRRGKKAHGEGIGNSIYKPQWIEMLGAGN